MLVKFEGLVPKSNTSSITSVFCLETTENIQLLDRYLHPVRSLVLFMFPYFDLLLCTGGLSRRRFEINK